MTPVHLVVTAAITHFPACCFQRRRSAPSQARGYFNNLPQRRMLRSFPQLRFPAYTSLIYPARFFLHTEPHPSDARLDFVREELGLIDRISAPPPHRPQEPLKQDQRSGANRVVELSHPWPEWVQLMEILLRDGYLNRSALRMGDGSPSSSSLDACKDANLIRTACLNFARDRIDIIRYLSRKDIYIIGQYGCPSLDRKVVNSGKRLRAYVGIPEGDICSSCSLRGNCERAFVKAREEEIGRTVDVMRILLTYGLDIINGSMENPACLNKTVKESVKKLLDQIVEFSAKELDPNSITIASNHPLRAQGKASRHQLFKGQISVPMKQGDWICPKCNFLNFAKNLKCLRCNGESQERFKKLQEDQEHLPLKKGDWICGKCNFLNFAKNTKCLQCLEKPQNRQLNPGEWECVSCNYINFRKNEYCLKCNWKRPKAMNTEHLARCQHNDQVVRKNNSFSFVEESNTNAKKFGAHEYDSDFWSSAEDRSDDGSENKFDSWKGFDNFPIIGGRSALSRDLVARQRWKEEMTKRSRQDSLGEFYQENDAGVIPPSLLRSTAGLDDCCSDDDMSEWFASKKS